MIAERGKYYKHKPTGIVKLVTWVTKDGDHIRFNDNTWVSKESFDEYWEETKNDNRVNHPSYYQDPSGVECITIVRHRDFNIGNALKYLWRAGLKTEAGLSNKEKTIEDLNKAIWYIRDEIKMLQNDKGNNSGTAESND